MKRDRSFIVRHKAFKVAANAIKNIENIDLTPAFIDESDDDVEKKYPNASDSVLNIRDSFYNAFYENLPLDNLSKAQPLLVDRLEEHIVDLNDLWGKALKELKENVIELNTQYSKEPDKLKEMAKGIRNEYISLGKEYKNYKQMIEDLLEEVA